MTVARRRRMRSGGARTLARQLYPEGRASSPAIAHQSNVPAVSEHDVPDKSQAHSGATVLTRHHGVEQDRPERVTDALPVVGEEHLDHLPRLLDADGQAERCTGAT